MAKRADGQLDLAAIRRELPMLRECCYLNSAWAGVTANPVIQKLLDEIALFERQGEIAYYPMQGKMNAARERLAAYVGVPAGEITFTNCATDGNNLVIGGLIWKDGDEIVVSDQEHPGLNNPLYFLQTNSGVRIKTFEVDPDPDTTLRHVKALITSRTRLIACSHVTCESGTRIPVRELCSFAAERGILTLIDGAQAIGMFAVDIDSIGCDFYASNGHKWLHGPKGTGFLWLKRGNFELLRPTRVGATSFDQPTDVRDMHLVDSARRYEYGTRSYATYAGLSAAIEWLDELGWERVEQQMKDLSDHLKDQLRTVPGAKLVSPREWELSSALVCFSIEGMSPSVMQSYLWDKGKIRSRVFPDRPILRISPAYFNTEDEIDFTLRVLRKMVAENRR